MSLVCTDVRERLADGELGATDREHLASCAECAAVARALGEIDDGLAAMAAIDAPDALVANTLDAARTPVPAHAPEPEPLGAPSLLVASLAMIASALGALLAAPIHLVRWMATRRTGRWTFALGSGLAACAALLFTTTYRAEAPSFEAMRPGEPPPPDQGPLGGLGGDAPVETATSTTTTGSDAPIAGRTWEEMANARDQTVEIDGRYRSTIDEQAIDLAQTIVTQSAPEVPVVLMPPTVTATPAADPGDDLGRMAQLEDGERDRGGEVIVLERDGQDGTPRETTLALDLPAQEAPAGSDRWHEEGRAQRGPIGDQREAEVRIPAGHGVVERGEQTEGATVTRQLGPVDETRRRELEVSGGRDVDGLEDALRAEIDDLEDADEDAELPPVTSRFWSDATVTNGLSFQACDGWWSTTYVPGDPAMRAVHARLAAAPDARIGDRSALALAETARPIAASIEAPTDRAIALGVQADVAAVEGPTRVRVEVDLRGIRQAAGRRAPMRIAVVLDARTALSEGEQARARALLASLGRAAGARDRITVLAIGEHGGTLVPLGVLRHGEVEVALRRLFAGEGGASFAADAALGEGARAVASADDVGLVLLATPDASHDGALDEALHRAAISGVPTSVVAIGDRARPADLDAIALAGQGRRRIVGAPSDADAIARAEIEAASQLVARALRLRVRLAPGVQLVDVIGSRPLDALEVDRTRRAERAIDRDLAQRLGIAADRDEDDDGIRIFVPAFYADDAHAVLLDVVVPGPGPIAEVDVRFKDLVRLENGQASGALSLPRGAAARGPRELRVVGALLAHETSEALAEAGDLVSSGDRPAAIARLRAARAAIDETRRGVPALARDRSVTALAQLLDRYLEGLASSSDLARLADSARYASHRLIVRPRWALSD